MGGVDRGTFYVIGGVINFLTTRRTEEVMMRKEDSDE